MRSFFGIFKAFRRLGRAKQVEVFDPVAEFRKELGLDKSKRSGFWMVRVLRASHELASTDKSLNVTTAVIAVTAVVVAVTAVTTVTVVVAVVVAVTAVTTVTVVVAVTAAGLKQSNRVFFYTLLGELAVVAGVGAFLGHPVVSAIPFVVLCCRYLVAGVGSGYRSPSPQMNAEDSVAEVFDTFIAQYRPDLIENRSGVTRELTLLRSKISELKSILSQLDGELKVEIRREGVRECY